MVFSIFSSSSSGPSKQKRKDDGKTNINDGIGRKHRKSHLMLNWYSLDEKIKLNKWVYLKRAQKAMLCIINNWMIKMQHLIPDGRFHDANCGGNNRKPHSSRRLQRLMFLEICFQHSTGQRWTWCGVFLRRK